MKRISLTLVVIFAVIFICGCETSVKEVTFIDVNGYNTPTEPTYKFVASSEHFGMATGKAYYDNSQGFFLTNFSIIKSINKMKDIEKYYIDLRFKDIPMFSSEWTYLNGKNFEEELASLTYEEFGEPKIDEYGESDAFFETKQSEFKDSIELIIKYCYKNGKCISEKLEFNYIDKQS